MSTQRITPCLWFDHEAEEAAAFYVSIFKNSKITAITKYPAAGQEIHGRPAGSVMTVEFTLDGQPLTGLNGGPAFRFTEAVSLQVFCDSQEEIDNYASKLSVGGDPRAQQCGWLKDKYGFAWQIVPRKMASFFEDETSDAAKRTMTAMLTMKTLDIAALQRAHDGK